MKILKKLFSRFTLVGLTIILLFLLMVGVLIGAFLFVNLVVVVVYPEAESYIRWAITILDYIIMIVCVLHVANRDMVPETKVPWLICIISLNLFGAAIYAVFSSHRPSRRSRRLYRNISAKTAGAIPRAVPRAALHAGLGRWAAVSESLSTAERSAVIHSGTATKYFPSGEAMWQQYLADLKGAEKFIFLEYFIIEKGQFWDSILAVLEQKAKDGVEVRLMYDDIGSMSKVRFNYHRKLRKKGIACVKFNPFVPVVANVHNNRDHRKITVIDGKVGYTGGLNLADEYVNVTHPFGYWKDTAVRIEGQAVNNLTLNFLQLYDMQTRKAEDAAPYLTEYTVPGAGFVQPYFDGPAPLYGRHIGEDVYISIINEARDYVYMTTPYLIIDYRMREALVMAALRGVDVRILTPHIPDKKLVFSLTRSNYMALIKEGVKIYEYTPGFVHAKMILADDEVGTVGTINFDYRSFLYHFENAVFMYRTEALREMKEDMASTFAASKLQTEEDAKRNVVFRFICELAKIFAPLF